MSVPTLALELIIRETQNQALQAMRRGDTVASTGRQMRAAILQDALEYVNLAETAAAQKSISDHDFRYAQLSTDVSR